MSELIGNKCGVVVANDLHDALAFGESLNHRGREAAGIAAISENRIDVVKWLGKSDEFRKSTIFNILSHNNYHTFFFHNRYATQGKEEDLLQDAHPHAIDAKVIDNKGNHIIMLGCEATIIHNGHRDISEIPEFDKKNLNTGCDSEGLLHFFRQKGEDRLMENFSGGGTLAIADVKRDEVIVMRDATGIRPGIVGRKDKYYGVASEDIAFKRNGGRFIEDITPGTIYYFSRDGKSYRKKKILEPKRRECFFEWNYLSHEETILHGVSVRRIRETLGEMLASEFIPERADFVTYLPESPDIAARRYAERTDILFQEIFYKKKAERSFLGTNNQERAESIRKNLHIYTHMLPKIKGKCLVIVDDSTVRGNNGMLAAKLAIGAGVNKIYHINYTPPIGIIGIDGISRGCKFGVDMPPNDSFIARVVELSTKGEVLSRRNRSLEEISSAMGMETHYLSVNGMLRAFEKQGIQDKELCTYCIGGESPVE